TCHAEENQQAEAARQTGGPAPGELDWLARYCCRASNRHHGGRLDAVYPQPGYCQTIGYCRSAHRLERGIDQSGQGGSQESVREIRTRFAEDLCKGPDPADGRRAGACRELIRSWWFLC